MNKKFYFFSIVALVVAMFFYNEAYSQGAKRYVLFEHFTNTGCGPCASQNPIFRAFYEKNTDRAHHIAFHPWWPSSNDPMYVYNKEENKEMTQYYNVTGVPAMFANGKSIGSPANANEDMLAEAGLSPLEIIVEQETGNDSISAKVIIKSKNTLPDSKYIMRVAIVERLCHYSGAPNGEKEFPNVFRRFLAKKAPFTAAAVGEEKVFDYKFAIDKSEWNPSEIYVLAYVVNTKDKTVVNSGSSLDWHMSLLSLNFAQANKDTFTYNFYVDNNTGEDQKILMELEGDYPAGWTYAYEYDGKTYSNLDTIFHPGRTPLKVLVYTNGARGTGNFYLKISSVDKKQVLRSKFVGINNVTTLIVTYKDPFVSSVDLVTPYQNGLELANNESPGYLTYANFEKFYADSMLTELKNVFLSVGWNFPAFTDNLVAQLAKILDNGGNLMLSGQDVAWDVLSGHEYSHGTPAQKQFMEKYLKTKFIADGNSNSLRFRINKEDAIFGGIKSSSIKKIYGSSNLFPDQIEPTDTSGHVFLNYTNNGKPGGYWLRGDNYKVVFLGIGVEQISSKTTANEIIKRTKNWFEGKLKAEDLFGVNALLGNSIPNPANDHAIISVSNNAGEKLFFEVYDISGKRLYHQNIQPGETKIKLNTSGYENGMYFYSVSNGKSKITKKLVIQH